MKQVLLVLALPMLIVTIVNAQTSSGNNVLGTTGVTAIQSITSSYKLSVGGSIKQFGTGDNGTSSPTLYLRNTTSGTGRNWGINSGNSGLFQILDSNASNAIRFVINSAGKIGIGTTSPSEQISIAGTDGGIHIGTTMFGSGYNGIWLNGSTNANDYNLLSKASDNNLYINRPSGKKILFAENDNDQISIASGGNVGLGISFNAAVTKLQINTTAAEDGILLQKNAGSFVRLMPGNLGTGSFNLLSQSGDAGLIFGNSQQASGSNSTFGFVLAPWYNGTAGLRMDTAGRIGIGKAAPTAPLDVNGNIKTTGFILSTGASTGKILVSNDANGTASWQTFSGSGWALSGNTGINPANTFIGTTDNQPVIIRSNNLERLRVDTGGRVGIGTIGTSDTAYKLFVEKGIRTRKIKVDVGTWSDYVFDNDYTLRSLSDLEKFIADHKHLPDVPSVKEVTENGVNLGENQAVLLRKIEELTLYVIEQNKKIDQQQHQLAQQQQQINELKEVRKEK